MFCSMHLIKIKLQFGPTFLTRDVSSIIYCVQVDDYYVTNSIYSQHLQTLMQGCTVPMLAVKAICSTSPDKYLFS